LYISGQQPDFFSFVLQYYLYMLGAAAVMELAGSIFFICNLSFGAWILVRREGSCWQAQTTTAAAAVGALPVHDWLNWFTHPHNSSNHCQNTDMAGVATYRNALRTSQSRDSRMR
jgi:hypothetical protein